MKTIDEKIAAFLAAPAFGVAGASKNRDKYGNKVLRCFLQNGRTAIPVNPVETDIEGVACVKAVSDLPPQVQSLSIITPPQVTDKVVEQAISRGIKHLWMQPGAQSAAAIAACERAGVNLIADGSCVLVVLGYHDHQTIRGKTLTLAGKGAEVVKVQDILSIMKYGVMSTPALPTRLMVGLHYLRHAFNESGESVVARLLKNGYWMYFCGFEFFIHRPPPVIF